MALVHRANLKAGQVFIHYHFISPISFPIYITIKRIHLQVLLVLGAAGGVGLAAVQIGKVCGAIVVAVARYVQFFYVNSTLLLIFLQFCNDSVRNLLRGNEKVEFLKSMGVDHVVDLSKGGVIESVKSFLKTKKLKGVDVVLHHGS